MLVLNEIFLEGKIPIIRLNDRSHWVIGHGQNNVINTEGAAEHPGYLTQGLPGFHPPCSLDMKRQISIPQSEPDWAPKFFQCLQEIPGLIRPAPP